MTTPLSTNDRAVVRSLIDEYVKARLAYRDVKAKWEKVIAQYRTQDATRQQYLDATTAKNNAYTTMAALRDSLIELIGEPEAWRLIHAEVEDVEQFAADMLQEDWIKIE